VLAATNTDGAWYPDRYRPAGFTSAIFGGGNVLKISIDGINDGLANRPNPYQAGFYNTQGRKFNQCGSCVTVLKGDVYIPADWATKHRRTDMWATGMNSTNTNTTFPIIGFRNPDGVSPGIYYWDDNAGIWINSGIVITYNSWYHLQFRIAGPNIEYLVNNAVVGTISASGSTYFGNIIMQAYNFNDPTLPLINQSTDSYDAYWDNLITTGTGGNLVTNVNTGLSYCSIQAAIDDPLTVNGNTIVVSAGTYNENVTVSKALSLRGANYGVSCSGSRGSESVVNGTAGSGSTTIKVNSDNVTIDGFSITNHAGSLGISESGRSNLDFEHNRIFDIGNSATGQASSWGIDIEAGITQNSSNIVASNNCINNIRGGANAGLSGAAGKTNNGSGGGVLVGSSGDTKSVTGVVVSSNIIDHITASTVAFNDGGKGAYGVQFNVRGSSTGMVASSSVINNEINTLEGLWAHGVGLEGRTPNAQVTNNLINGLVDHKGNTDADGVRLEDNDAAGSVMVNNNSFTNMKFGISNTMSTTVNGTCNWYGSADAPTVTSMIEGHVTYIPYLTSGVDNPTVIGFQPTGACNGTVKPTITFTASSLNGSQTTTNGSPSTISVNICNGGNLTLSGFGGLPSSNVGAIEKVISSGNIIYNGGSVPGDRPTNDITPSNIQGYFNKSYGTYVLASGQSGTIDQTYIPYYDVDNSNSYTPGDILGDTITLHYNIYAAPTISCPGSTVIKNTDPNACSAMVTYPVTITGYNPTVGYTFSGVTSGSGSGTGSGSSFNKGVTHVNITVSSPCGNSTSCSFDVKVEDHQNPAIICPPNQTVPPTSLNGATVTYTAPTGTDNCPGTATTRTGGPASGSTFPIGTTTVTYKATDAAGNSTTCSFTVTVSDLPYCDKNDKDKKVNVCHNGKTLCISINALDAHLKQGDQLGECSSSASSASASGASASIGEQVIDMAAPEVKSTVPLDYNISNFPNPFRNMTTIKYNVPVDSKVSVKIYNLSGQVMATLVDGDKKAGTYTVQFNASNLAIGTYYAKYVATSANQQSIKSQQLSVTR
jgi:hypothetical protein